MADGAEVEERVDLDEENYMEEIDDDVEEQIDEDGAGDGDGGENSGGNFEGMHKESLIRTGEKGDILEVDEDNPASQYSEDVDTVKNSANGRDKEKWAQLLALPPHGSEIFIGGLARDATEEDLKELCQSLGEILEIRLVKDRDTGDNKGYAFVAFKSKERAQDAISVLHSKEFKSRTLRCSLSESKHRLFIGNVPKSWTEDEFRKHIESVGPGVENIELIKDPQNPNKNRGFAFVLYHNNACADYSRQKMSSASFKLDGSSPTVSWADPKSSSDNSATAQVKALYVKNIPENTTVEQLKELFQRHGEVTRVVMPPGKAGNGKRDFGFVHYAERLSALKAVKDTEKYEIDGQVLEVVFAKPQSDKKPDGPHPHSHGAPPPNHFLHPGYGGFAGNPYGSLGSGYGSISSFQQPMIYGRGPMPAGMQMVPMVLPDGRIGYVFQQSGVQMPPPRPPRRTDRDNGPSGGTSGRHGSGDEGGRGGRYKPY